MVKKQPKYYFFNKSKGRYCINKYIDKKLVFLGYYNTEKEAKLAVKLFHKYGWSKENIWRIKAEIKEILKK